jgi:hypothetical protein
MSVSACDLSVIIKICNFQDKYICSHQCYGTVKIFTVPVPTFDKFRFRCRLLTSSGSSADFGQVTVPVPAPYQDHKKHNFQSKIWKKSCLFSFT